MSRGPAIKPSSSRKSEQKRGTESDSDYVSSLDSATDAVGSSFEMVFLYMACMNASFDLFVGCMFPKNSGTSALSKGMNTCRLSDAGRTKHCIVTESCCSAIKHFVVFSSARLHEILLSCCEHLLPALYFICA